MNTPSTQLPTVSVITVCRNVAGALRRTAASVLAQRYPALEYVVVDGASTDDTAAVLATLSPDVKVVSEPDNGIYDAMNKGVAMARGEWVIFMNAGDLFATDTVLADIFGNDLHAEADVVYGGVVKNGNVCAAPAPPRRCHRMFFCHQSALTRRRCLLERPFDVRHRMSADFKFFKTLLREGARFDRVELPVAVFDTSGVSNRRRSDGLLDNMRVVCECDTPATRLRLLPHLLFPYLICRLRGK